MGEPIERLAEVGLGFVNKRGRPQDSFRARVMFPIFTETGDAVAFGGRVLPGSDDPAKYKNSTETTIYSKSRTLYGLNWAKQDVTAADEVVVCEGYTDVIGFHGSGVRRAVATCGTALTEDHVRLLKRFARSVVLAFDADRAGQGAAERFYAWEQKFDVSVRVASFPEGRDPGDLAQSDPERLVAAVRDAQRFLGFRVQEVLRTGSLASPEDRARTAQRAMAVINEHPDVNVRRMYAGEVAAKVGIPAADLVQSAERRSATAPVVAPASRRRENAEFVAIAMLIFRWDDIAPWMAEELFDGEETRRAFRALAAAAETRSAESGSLEEEAWRLVNRALELADPDARDVLERAAASDVATDDGRSTHDGRSVAEAEALNLIRAAVRRRLATRTALVDHEVIRADREVRQLLEQLDDPDMSEAAAGELLSWLRDREEEPA
jgi:DNA primase